MKRLLFDPFRAVGNPQDFETAAIGKGAEADRLYAPGDPHLLQRRETVERKLPDRGHSALYNQRFDPVSVGAPVALQFLGIGRYSLIAFRGEIAELMHEVHLHVPRAADQQQAVFVQRPGQVVAAAPLIDDLSELIVRSRNGIRVGHRLGLRRGRRFRHFSLAMDLSPVQIQGIFAAVDLCPLFLRAGIIHRSGGKT